MHAAMASEPRPFALGALNRFLTGPCIAYSMLTLLFGIGVPLHPSSASKKTTWVVGGIIFGNISKNKPPGFLASDCDSAEYICRAKRCAFVLMLSPHRCMKE